MKHNLNVTFILVLVFLVSQLVGLAVVNQYVAEKRVDPTTGETEIVYEELPLNIERPPVNQNFAWLFIVAAVIVGTLLALVLIHFRTVRLWKVWFFLSVLLCLTVAFKPAISSVLTALLPFASMMVFGLRFHEIVALSLAGFLAYRKVFKPSVILGNVTEVFIYGGLAAIFVPIININSAIIILVLISIYDMYAVWKSKHMVKLATFQKDSQVFAGLSIPYGSSGEATTEIKPVKQKKGKASVAALKKSTKRAKKVAAPVPEGSEVRTAILGGGDIGFPMFFAGVIMKTYSYTQTLFIPVCTAIALYLLLTYGKANRFYPAMPFLSGGCFVGYGLILLFF